MIWSDVFKVEVYIQEYTIILRLVQKLQAAFIEQDNE